MSLRFNVCQHQQIRLCNNSEWVTTCGRTDAAAVLLWIDFGPYYLRRLYDIWSPTLSKYRLMIWYTGNNSRQMNRLAVEPAPVYEHIIHCIHQLSEQVARQPVILVGHSFGSLFALPAASRQPDLYHSYIGIGQCIKPAETVHSAYQSALNTAQSLRHRRVFFRKCCKTVLRPILSGRAARTG
ncbi:MAG: hypothetical protein U5R06_24590 [candidate division KSB1 bacterium]|nr:hypothetical protein [candidate division KSB1 bacterium]